MAINVHYKDNMITSFSSNTGRTLNTAGRFMEDNITIWGNINLQSKTVTPSTSTQVITNSTSTYSRSFTANNNQSNNPLTSTINLSFMDYGTMYYISGNVQYMTNYGNSNGTIGFDTYWQALEDGDIEYYVSNANGNAIPTNITLSKTQIKIYFADGTILSRASVANGVGLYNTLSINAVYDGLEQVTVNPIPSNYIVPTGTLQISGNGTYDVSSYASAEVTVASSINNQSKTVTPTESQQTVSADSGYTGLSTVTVNAISNTYVGSGITRRSSSDLSASGATVTVPAGYYASQATKSVSTTTHPNPTASINTSTGLVTASHTQTAGYVSAGTTTGTMQLTTQAATTITPTTSSQTAVAAGRYTTGIVTVAAIPSNYIDSSTLKTYYTGSSAPSSSLGANGDLYFQSTGA